MINQETVLNEQTYYLLSGTSSGGTAVTWLYMDAAGAGAGYTLTDFAFETIMGLTERIELHKGKIDDYWEFASLNCETLHTVFFSQYGEWNSTDGWKQGDGVHGIQSEYTNPDNADEPKYFTIKIFFNGKGPGAVAMRLSPATGLNGL